jgi:hypothetical protein
MWFITAARAASARSATALPRILSLIAGVVRANVEIMIVETVLGRARRGLLCRLEVDITMIDTAFATGVILGLTLIAAIEIGERAYYRWHRRREEWRRLKF